VGVTDRYWRPIEPAEAERVFGRPVEIVAAHLRWLFAVAHCRWDGGEAILKRQPPMGRTVDQLLWQHRLTNHLADAGIPATRVRRMVELDGLWYEIADVATGDDAHSGTDTWEPFHSPAHAAEAGAVLAQFHDAALDFTPARPQPQAGFVVQLDLVRLEPADAVAELAAARPAVAGYLADVDWRAPVTAAYAEAFRRLRPVVPELPRTGLHGDWQTNNLFFDGGRISGIIDFHQADHGPAVLDLATAVERNCFFWNRISEGEDDAYDLDHAAALVGAYDGVRPLSPAERAAFADVLACCQFEYGISFLDYYWGIEGDREKADWAWHTFVLGHAQWWQTSPGQSARRRIEGLVAQD
jgi:Ser/Thr protein kinase RdoA (MazF antagonist)